MTAVYKIVTAPAREYSDLSHLICDLCGARTREGEASWGADTRHVDVVTINHRSGKNWPADNTKTVAFDLCPTCFEQKLTPWLEGQGAKAREEGEAGW